MAKKNRYGIEPNEDKDNEIATDNVVDTRDTGRTVIVDCMIEFIKTHPDATLPSQAHDGDNCWDIYAVEDTVIPGSKGVSPNSVISRVTIGSATVETGLKVGYITPGFGFVFKSRSGLGFNHGILAFQGEIDSGYRGSAAVKLFNTTAEDYHVKKGDRIAQFKIEKIYNTTVSFTDQVVSTSARDSAGFGSSGK